MQLRTMTFPLTVLWLTAVLAGGGARRAVADIVTPISSSVDLDAQVRAGSTSGTANLATDPVSQSQGATINPLSVSTSATSNGGGTVSASGTLTSTWSSSSAGSLVYSNMTVQITNAFTGSYTFADFHDWRYTFQANTSGTFNLNYLVRQSATFGLPQMDGFQFVWDNGQGTTFTPIGHIVDPTDSGMLSRSIQAGQTYTAGIEISVDTAFGGGFAVTSTQVMNGTFDWSINPSAVAEPSSLTLLGLGAAACAGRGWIGRRRRRTGQAKRGHNKGT
jgi:hypothetical protein